MSFRSFVKLSVLAFLVMNGACPLKAQDELDSRLKKVDFEQRLGQQVSLGLDFTDEEGRKVSLQRYFNGKPVVLVPGYYGCPMLCRAMATGVSNALRDLPQTVGQDFEVVNYSIDPGETPALAAQKKRSYLKAYRRAGSENGWHFLTGDKDAIRKLSDEIGFHYFYDETSKQFAHPAGIVLLTPGGKISHYLFGVNLSPDDLRHGLADASGEHVGFAIKRLLLLCFHYQPITGRYAFAAIATVRGAALLLVVGMVVWIVSALRTEKGAATKEIR